MTETATLSLSKPGRMAALLASLATTLGAWRAERATLAAVEGLDAHLLRDIGFEVSPGPEAVRRRLMIL
ncbi:DUF1127 domain-containing protein [Elioraea rosea]|uniref:DUF1127 domain-containing protein n=1 Tax=Elioraea rosea TaxID=2492390 RepID=UPI001315A8BD|nr:DUF1127 domain-containing protein [Elioraea rosea]